MATAGRKAQVKVAGSPVAFTNEPTTSLGNSMDFQVTAATKRVWDRTAAIVVGTSGDGGTTYTTAAAGTYTVNRLTGTISFLLPQLGPPLVRVSGSYLPLSVVGEASEYSYSLTAKNAEFSRLGDIYTSRAQTLKDVTGSLSRWYAADPYFTNALTAETPVILEFYANSGTAPDLRCWALVGKEEIKAAMDGLVETTVSWEGFSDTEGRMISLV
ncbi:MAG: hypothetical protein JO040_01765 [Gemmatimonadetes bacterium]|nr:hypothetical protein [Gemmatimonadota bacterium]